MDAIHLELWQLIALGAGALAMVLLIAILAVVAKRNQDERQRLNELEDDLNESIRAVQAALSQQSLGLREEQLRTLQAIGDSLAGLLNRSADQQNKQFSLWQQSAYEHDRSQDGRQARMYQLTEESLGRFEQRMKPWTRRWSRSCARTRFASSTCARRWKNRCPSSGPRTPRSWTKCAAPWTRSCRTP
jgi:hypothetical protein